MLNEQCVETITTQPVLAARQSNYPDLPNDVMCGCIGRLRETKAMQSLMCGVEQPSLLFCLHPQLAPLPLQGSHRADSLNTDK